MSDLQAPSAQTQAAAPITSVAIGKLRAISSRRALLAQNDGLIDAFAEVFASMAASQPVLAKTSASDSESSPTVADQRPDKTGEVASTGSQLSDNTSPSDADADQVAINIEQESASINVDDRPQQETETEHEEIDDSTDIGVAEHVVADEIDVAIVEVHDSAEDGDQSETVEVIAPEVAEDGDSGRHRRDRRDSAAVEPVRQGEAGGQRADRRNSGTEPIDGEGKTIDPEANQPVGPVLETDAADSSRRQRGRDGVHRESAENNLQPSSNNHRTRSGQGSPVVPSTSDASASLAAAQRGDTASRPSLAANVESTITNIQNVASSAAGSSRQNAARGTVQPATRTHAIEAAQSGRDISRPAPNPQASKNNTADTVSRVKLIQRVSKAFQHLGPEGGVVRLRLAPAELGSVRVEMRINQRKVQARVIADTEAASAALREHLPELRQRLESQGMQVERLEIEVEQGESFFENPSGRGHRRDTGDGNRHSSFAQPPSLQDTRADGSSASATASVSQPAAPPSTGGVDVRL